MTTSSSGLSMILDLIGELREKEAQIEREMEARIESVRVERVAAETTYRLLANKDPSNSILVKSNIDFTGARNNNERLKRIARAGDMTANATRGADLLLERGAAKGKRRNLVSNLYTIMKESPEWKQVREGESTFRLLEGDQSQTKLEQLQTWVDDQTQGSHAETDEPDPHVGDRKEVANGYQSQEPFSGDRADKVLHEGRF